MPIFTVCVVVDGESPDSVSVTLTTLPTGAATGDATGMNRLLKLNEHTIFLFVQLDKTILDQIVS